MTKTFKLGAIFLITVVNLQVFRLIFNFINLPDNIAGWLFSFLFQGLSLGLVPYLLYRAWIGKNNRDFLNDFKLSPKISPYSYLIAIAIGFLVFYINIGASSVWYLVLKIFGYTHTTSVGTIFSSPEVLVFELLATAVMPAIFEELVDRGLLLSVFSHEKNDKKVILIIGFFFGFLHQNIAQFGPTVFGGIVMAYMAVKCRNIVPGMIVHFMNNAILTLISYSSQTGGGLGRLYESFGAFYSSSFLLTLATWAAAIWLLVALLHTFEKINRKYREKSDPLPVEEIPQKPAFVSPSANNRVTWSDDYFYKIYGAPRNVEPKPAFVSIEPSQESVPARKTIARWWEYGLVYCAFLSAALVTLFTFLWGILR
ncbi:MAG: type II CAAX endopeptidase family protein [Clostridia bacterium]|nr:type II CAAX endopeptidase family protein [Clostridia bacterium]